MTKQRRIVRLVGGFALLGLIVLGAFFARLSIAPMPIAWVDDLIRTPLEDALPGVRVQFDTPQLMWNTQEHSLDLQLSNVVFARANEADSQRLAVSPLVDVAISVPDLLVGQVRPVRLDLVGARLDLKWSSENVARRLRGEAPEPAPAPQPENANTPAIFGLVRALLGSGEIEGPLSQMRSVNILDGDIRLQEITTGAQWSLPGAVLSFERAETGLSVDINVVLETPGQRAQLTIASLTEDERAQDYPLAAGRDVLRFVFEEINLAQLARSVNMGGLLQTVDMPVFGSVDVGFDETGVAEWASFALGSGSGEISVPSLYEHNPVVDQLELVGRYEHATRTLRLDTFLAELSGGQISADAVVRWDTELGKPDLRLFADLTDMNIRDVLTYWPARLAPGAHRWIDLYMPAAQVTKSRFQIAINAEDWGKKPLPDGAVRIDLAFEGATAHYKQPLPPVTGASGTGIVLSNQVDIWVEDGEMDGLRILPSHIMIEKSGRKETAIAHIEVSAAGDVSQMLSFLDREPLGYTSRFGIDAGAVSGEVEATARFTFPPVQGLTFADVEMEVDATTRGLGVPAIMKGGGLSHGNLNFHVEKTGLTAHGPVRIRDVPLELHWEQDFVANTEDRPLSTFLLSGSLGAAELEKFGLPAAGRVEGTTRVNMTVQSDGKRLRSAEVDVDLFEASINSRRLKWTKPAASPGTARFKMKWEDQQFWIDEFLVKSEGFEASGNLLFDQATSSLREAYISRLVSAGHDLSMVASLGEEKSFQLRVDAERLDLSGFLDDMMGGGGTGYVPEAVILINAKQATGRNGVTVKDFVLDAWNAGGYWTTADVRGTFAAEEDRPEHQGDFRLILSGTFDKRNVELSSSNAGRLALGLGLFRNGAGGTLSGAAQLNGRGQPSSSSGLIRIDDFRVVKSSVLVEALEEEASGYGVDDMIGPNGMQFDEMELPFTIDQGVIEVDDAHAYGAAMGFTMEGQLDQGMQQLNLNGLVIPAYSLNTLLGNIPIVGSLLGGKDGGLFALEYRVQGPRSAPNVSFNPLSAIAPGFLRNLFMGGRGRVDVSEPAQPPQDPSAGASNEDEDGNN